jgi:hypothetical protein
VLHWRIFPFHSGGVNSTATDSQGDDTWGSSGKSKSYFGHLRKRLEKMSARDRKTLLQITGRVASRNVKLEEHATQNGH